MNVSGCIVNHRRSPCTRPSTSGVACWRRCSPAPAGPTTSRVDALFNAIFAASTPFATALSRKRVRPRSASRAAPATVRASVNNPVALPPKKVDQLISCSQCSVWAPPRFRKSGFALKLKQFTKYRSTETSLCSHSCGEFCCSSKDRFCFDTAGVKYSSVISWPINASALSSERSSSSAPTPPSTIRGFFSKEAALLSSTALAKSATEMRFMALDFLGLANVDLRARTPTVAFVSVWGGPSSFVSAALLSVFCFASSSRSDRFTLSTAPRSKSCTLVPMPLATACASSASASSRVFSYVSFPASTIKLRL
mmetsp:Transcript_18696/g.48874  ORF Transcript_18696/g.48874 Transcript_18696/m.48874 type:complete len:310 (-) Transcript_18696:180-1109(-)